MAKEELLILDGPIDKILPDGPFRTLLEIGTKIITYGAGPDRIWAIGCGSRSRPMISRESGSPVVRGAPLLCSLHRKSAVSA